ncbi:MAG: hypothetical protein KHX56_06075 [Clostridiales bacterium]|nr:hypothetical protein [Clostridiales bacterium]
MMNIYGIPRPHVLGSIDYIQLFQWLWLTFGLLILAGFISSGYFKMYYYTVLRYRSYRNWYFHYYIKIMLLWLVYCLALFLLGNTKEKNFWGAWGLLSIHLFFILSIFVLVVLLSQSIVFTTVFLFLFQGIGYIVTQKMGVSDERNPLVWGMICRSTIYENSSSFDYIFVIIVQCFFILFLGGLGYFKVKDILRNNYKMFLG